MRKRNDLPEALTMVAGDAPMWPGGTRRTGATSPDAAGAMSAPGMSASGVLATIEATAPSKSSSGEMPALQDVPTLLLASESPRRIEVLGSAGIPFRAEAAGIDDDKAPVKPGESAVDMVLSRSRDKAFAVSDRFPASWVVGADTVVALDGRLLGKPADRADAERMIRLLAGREHAVFSGITLVNPDGGFACEHCESRVRIEPPSEKRLAAFLDSGLWEGKAGAYGIQDAGHPDALELVLVSGSRSNVIGLPMSLLLRMLSDQGYPVNGEHRRKKAGEMQGYESWVG